MTIQACHFTPEVMLSAPRRSPGVPNPTGDLILYTVSNHQTHISDVEADPTPNNVQVSTYSFESHTKTNQIRVLSIREGNSHLVSANSSDHEPVWISKDEIIFLRPTDEGCTAVLSQNVFDSPE
jgi:hypothetical protein